MASPSLLQADRLSMIPMADLQLGDLIGEGGFGKVYRGKWKDKDVAIKQLFLKKLSASLVKEFENEAEIMAQSAKCPQIVKLFGICKEPGHYSLVMEYMSRGSLYDVLHDDEIELPWKTVCVPIALDIGRGLSYLHDRDILHRDLKSLNIVVNENFGAKITDFGLAKLKLESSSKTGSIQKNAVGTVRWKAPELFKRGDKYSTASDVYSYGMILWEIASRKLPFSDGRDDVTVMGWIKEGEKETIPEGTPPEYSKLITLAWSKKPHKRPSTQSIVLSLEKLLPNPIPKSWHIDPETKIEADALGKESFDIPASAKDIEKVVSFYSSNPVPGFKIGSVKVVYNPTFNRSFESHMKKLQKRHGNRYFDPKWSMDQGDKQFLWRKKIQEMFEEMAKPYTDPDYPNVKLLPLWHGTNAQAIKSISEVGYANPTKIDDGFFGKGMYSTHEAEYAHRVFSMGALFLNWVAVYSPYPVVRGDEDELFGKGSFENYDAHFIPVSPRNPGNEASYDPCIPFTKHTYTEVVVFESAACLPRYLVELVPDTDVPLPLELQNMFRDLFTTAAELRRSVEEANELLKPMFDDVDKRLAGIRRGPDGNIL